MQLPLVLMSVMLAVVIANAPLSAQGFTPRVAPPPDRSEPERWTAVLAVPEGTLLAVDNRAGVTTSGSLRSADADRLVLTTEAEPVELLRSSIVRVFRLGAKKTGKYARRGFLVGAVIGATQGALTVETNKAAWILGLAAAEGSIGALIGAIHGSGTRERTLIYEAVGL